MYRRTYRPAVSSYYPSLGPGPASLMSTGAAEAQKPQGGRLPLPCGPPASAAKKKGVMAYRGDTPVFGRAWEGGVGVVTSPGLGTGILRWMGCRRVPGTCTPQRGIQKLHQPCIMHESTVLSVGWVEPDRALVITSRPPDPSNPNARVSSHKP